MVLRVCEADEQGGNESDPSSMNGGAGRPLGVRSLKPQGEALVSFRASPNSSTEAAGKSIAGRG